MWCGLNEHFSYVGWNFVGRKGEVEDVENDSVECSKVYWSFNKQLKQTFCNAQQMLSIKMKNFLKLFPAWPTGRSMGSTAAVDDENLNFAQQRKKQFFCYFFSLAHHRWVRTNTFRIFIFVILYTFSSLNRRIVMDLRIETESICTSLLIISNIKFRRSSLGDAQWSRRKIRAIFTHFLITFSLADAVSRTISSSTTINNIIIRADYARPNTIILLRTK